MHLVRTEEKQQVAVVRRGLFLRSLNYITGLFRSKYASTSAMVRPSRGRTGRVEQGLRQIDWYHSTVADALAKAACGSYDQIGAGISALMSDGSFVGISSARFNGLLTLPISFHGEADAAEFWGKNFDRVFDRSELVKFVRNAFIAGVSLAEVVSTPFGYRFVAHEVEHQSYESATDTWRFQSAESGLVTVTPGDGRWVLFRPGGYVSPYKNGLFSALMTAYVCKLHARLYRDNYNDKLSHPRPIVHAPPGSTDEEDMEALEGIADWGPDAAAVLRPGWSASVLESNGNGTEVYASTIKHSDSEYSITLLGQTGTTEGSSGFSNLEVQDRVRRDLIASDAMALQRVLVEQVIQPLTLILFGHQDIDLIFKVKSSAEIKAESEAIDKFSASVETANKTLSSAGVRVSLARFSETFAIETEPLPVQETTSGAVFELTPSSLESVVSVREARANVGLPPLRDASGNESPDNDLTITEYKAKLGIGAAPGGV